MKDDELPPEYVPTELRHAECVARDKVSYVSAYLGELGAGHVCFAGPFDTLEQVLEQVPPCGSIMEVARRANAVVVRRNTDGTDEYLYRWSQGAPSRWKRVKT